MSTSARRSSPAPMPYHRAIVKHFQKEEPGLWKWFASTGKREEASAAVRLDLLKSTYRLEPALHPRIYDSANELRDLMSIKAPFTFYQAQTGNALNAAVAYIPGEAHVILAGPLADVLSAAELLAVLAHELAHFLLLDEWNGDYFVASELLRSLSADASAGPAYFESFRLYALWTEAYADRWAAHTSTDANAAISALIKIDTGLSEVSAESYLRQAEEIFAKGRATANQLTHPESYIRARALKLWTEQGEDADAEIERMIAGPLHLGKLDVLGQQRMAERTRAFLQAFLAPAWFQTEAAMGHAKQFFPDISAGGTLDVSAWKDDLRQGDATLREYFCYLMLDFVTVDRDLGDVALAAALVWSRRLEIHERFAEIVQKELGLGKKAFAKIDKGAEELLARSV